MLKFINRTSLDSKNKLFLGVAWELPKIKIITTIVTDETEVHRHSDALTLFSYNTLKEFSETYLNLHKAFSSRAALLFLCVNDVNAIHITVPFVESRTIGTKKNLISVCAEKGEKCVRMWSQPISKLFPYIRLESENIMDYLG